MMKNRVNRVIIVSISLLLITAMLSSCGLVNLIANAILLDESGFVNFNDLKYQRPDFQNIQNTFLSLIEKIEKNKNSLSIARSASEAFEMYNDAYTQYNLVQIRFYGNVNDTEVENEINYCAEQFALLDPIVNQFYNTALDNGYQKTFFNGWTEAQIEYIRIQKQMFDDDYVRLISRRTEIENEYMSLITNYTIQYNGMDYTIDNIKRSDKQYQTLVNLYYDSLQADVAVLYSEFVSINDILAEKAGFSSYAEFSHRYIYERDYSIEEINKMYQFVKKTIVPLYFEVDALLDTSVLSAAINSSNATFDAYDSTFKNYTANMSATMSQAYSFMKTYNLYNIGSSAGMQKAGFTTYLPSYSMPYIYLYTNGNLTDITSFVHEFGHFMSYYFNGNETDGIIDVAEIQSQANEWLFLPYYDLTEDELDQYTLYQLSETLFTIIQGCLLDEFQQVVYRDNIDSDYNALFESLAQEYRFDEMVPDELHSNYWALVHHNFVMPLYYISYAVSALPALEIFFLSQSDPEAAQTAYFSVLNENGYRSYLTVLKDASLHSPFEEATYDNLDQKIKNYLQTFK